MSDPIAKLLPVQPLDKKRNGIFYTPPAATVALCNWGIRSSDDNVLEPSFGGCEFLRASRDRLLSLLCSVPKDRLYGCDIDPAAFDYLSQVIGISDTVRRFIHRDFLKLRPDDFAVSVFECAIGNPPYVSHHNMSAEQKASAQAALEASGIRLKFKPSLWAYFVIHSLLFLKRGGRFAWILPGSFLHADYATEIRALLQQRFRRSLVVVLGERLFLGEGTDERSVILLCEDYCSDGVNGTMEVGFAADLLDLNSIIIGWQTLSWQGKNYETRSGFALMSDEAMASYKELESSAVAKKLGDLCKIKIGIVTGANDFFVINREAASAAKLPDNSLSYILAKFSYVRGTNLLRKDLNALDKANRRCLLINTSGISKVSGALKNYLDGFPMDKLLSNKTFGKRGIWYQPDDGQVPDAFFPYMQGRGPSLLLNGAGVTCTNTVHRIFFERDVAGILKKAVAISILSTFSQLSAEIQGRSYGSGILKHEPSEVSRITLLLPCKINSNTIRETFNKIDSLLRNGEIVQAQNIADKFVLSDYSERARQQYLSLLTQSLINARTRRIRSHKESNDPPKE
jgi:adenine-specific DNA-methyltransferase